MIIEILIALSKATLLSLVAVTLAVLAYDAMREIQVSGEWNRKAYSLPVALACFSVWFLCIAVKILQGVF